MQFVTGDTYASENNSLAPIVIYSYTIGDKTKVGSGDPLAPGYTILDESTKVINVCCDQIHIVFGDFDDGATVGAGEQYYKKYMMYLYKFVVINSND